MVENGASPASARCGMPTPPGSAGTTGWRYNACGDLRPLSQRSTQAGTRPQTSCFQPSPPWSARGVATSTAPFRENRRGGAELRKLMNEVMSGESAQPDGDYSAELEDLITDQFGSSHLTSGSCGMGSVGGSEGSELFIQKGGGGALPLEIRQRNTKRNLGLKNRVVTSILLDSIRSQLYPSKLETQNEAYQSKGDSSGSAYTISVRHSLLDQGSVMPEVIQSEGAFSNVSDDDDEQRKGSHSAPPMLTCYADEDEQALPYFMRRRSSGLLEGKRQSLLDLPEKDTKRQSLLDLPEKDAPQRSGLTESRLGDFQMFGSSSTKRASGVSRGSLRVPEALTFAASEIPAQASGGLSSISKLALSVQKAFPDEKPSELDEALMQQHLLGSENSGKTRRAPKSLDKDVVCEEPRTGPGRLSGAPPGTFAEDLVSALRKRTPSVLDQGKGTIRQVDFSSDLETVVADVRRSVRMSITAGLEQSMQFAALRRSVVTNEEQENIAVSASDAREARQLAKSYCMRQEEVLEIMRLFRGFDREQSGHISAAAADKLMTQALPKIFPGRRGNQRIAFESNTVTMREIVAWFFHHAFDEGMLVPVQQQQIRLLAHRMQASVAEVEDLHQQFLRFDSDGTGVIEFAEFKDLLHTLLKAPAGIEFPRSRMEFFWKEVDSNSNGTISFEEFYQWYRRYFRYGGGKDFLARFYRM
eukprot:TRINITY_DN20404_c0_g2_i1.p1 TRINITY_DN20404_c0_g2~~TRINITY_DN20404_c0_g2_i1.p1  ORF type:complete len:700 (-),score=132.59 TRINITY_DN20404_c0_g2_i1:279-2378(-)